MLDPFSALFYLFELTRGAYGSIGHFWGQNGHFWALLEPRGDNFVGAKNSNQLSQRWHNMFNPLHPLFNPSGATGASYVQHNVFLGLFVALKFVINGHK